MLLPATSVNAVDWLAHTPTTRATAILEMSHQDGTPDAKAVGTGSVALATGRVNIRRWMQRLVELVRSGHDAEGRPLGEDPELPDVCDAAWVETAFPPIPDELKKGSEYLK